MGSSGQDKNMTSNLHTDLASLTLAESTSVQNDTENKSCNLVEEPSWDSKCCKDSDCHQTESSDGPLHSDAGLLDTISLASSYDNWLAENVSTIPAACPPNKEDSLEYLQFDEVPIMEDSDLLGLIMDYPDGLINWLESEPCDSKSMEILSLLKEIKEIKAQLEERKDWAQKKVIQAAKKLNHDLIELKLLRMNKGQNERLKIEKQEFEANSGKKLLDMENALYKANYQLEIATKTVRSFEIQNSAIKADIEACKLSASESDQERLEVVKRMKKYNKKLTAWEKQKAKLQEESEEQKKKAMQVEEELLQLKKAQDEAEVKLRQEIEAKEHAFALFEEEKKLMDAAKVEFRQKNIALRQKIERDFQLLKDDKQRLEGELSHLKASKVPPELFVQQDFEEEVFDERGCLICSKNEACIVFLPCCHQVLCINCNQDHCKTVGAKCPYCQVQIEESIRVYRGS